MYYTYKSDHYSTLRSLDKPLKMLYGRKTIMCRCVKSSQFREEFFVTKRRLSVHFISKRTKYVLPGISSDQLIFSSATTDAYVCMMHASTQHFDFRPSIFVQ